MTTDLARLANETAGNGFLHSGRVIAGGDGAAYAALRRQMLTKLQLGFGKYFIPLSGGSDTRAAERDYWCELGAALGLDVVATGCSVTLRARSGGELPARSACLAAPTV